MQRSGKSGPKPGTVERLEAALREADFRELEEIIALLGEVGGERAVEPLLRIAREAGAVRHAALAALHHLAHDNEQVAVELALASAEGKAEATGGEYGVRVLTGRDRRRSPRVLLEIQVLVRWSRSDGTAAEEISTSEVVNANGALLRLRAPLPTGTPLEVINIRTRATATGRVVWSGNSREAGGFPVGVEFETPDENFWVGRAPA